MKEIINELKALVSEIQDIMQDCEFYNEDMEIVTNLDFRTTKSVFGILGKMEGLLFALTDFSDQNDQDTKHKELESFYQKQTNWYGLWYNDAQDTFSSGCIDSSLFKKYNGLVRIYAEKNKNYKNGTYRPEYVFCIKSSSSNKPSIATIKEREYDHE